MTSPRRRSILVGIALASLSLLTSQARAESKVSNKDFSVEGIGGGSTNHPARSPVIAIMPVGSSTLHIGEPIAFDLTSSAKGYAHLYAIDASGKTQGFLENTPIGTRRTLHYPSPGLIVRASPPSGDETLIFVVSRRPMHGFSGDRPRITPFDTQVAAANFKDALDSRMRALPRRDWVFTETHLRIQD